VTAPSDAPAPRRGAWVRMVADRIPTGWFAGILTAIFLGVTAAFGGLAAVAMPPVPDLPAGETHTSDQFALSLERAVLIDELPGSGVSPGDGQRVLALVVQIENTWTQPQPTAVNGSLIDVVRVPSLGDTKPAIARLDDATLSPYLQPGVPAELVLTWLVDADALADGADIAVDLYDHTLIRGELITYGDSWVDPALAAHAELVVEDVGAGADAAASDDGTSDDEAASDDAPSDGGAE
jgi:hypothetical protein